MTVEACLKDCAYAAAALMHAGGLDKLADIISPSAETLSTQEAAVGALQKTLKSAQAALEGRQAAVFGEQVRLFMTRRMQPALLL